jgi:hypothetical protein
MSMDRFDGYVVTLADPTGTIERECADKVFTQKSVALTYALAMSAEQHGVPVDWKRANTAITARWPKGLVRVKELAWKMVREKAGAQ